MGATVFFESSNELATLTNTFSVSGVATDPTTISLAITTPTGTTTTYTYAAAEITRSSAGVYTKAVGCSEDGVWQYVWTGTGTASDITAGTWLVRQTVVADLYCTVEMLKSRTGISDTLDDAEIHGACRAVSRWIDKYCNRVFYRRTATLTFEPDGWYVLDVPDLVSVTTLKTDSAGDGTYETTWTTSDYQLLPQNAASEHEPRPYTQVKAIGDYTFPTPSAASTARTDLVQIAGVWGWPAVPEPVAEAARILAGDYLKLGSMAFGVAGYGDYGAVRARMSSPAMSMLAPYRRNPILVG